jgi:hypothetical protein
MDTGKVRKWSVGLLGVVGIVVLIMAIPGAKAEKPIDFSIYRSCTFAVASDDKEFKISSYECLGTTRSNHENNVFDNMSILDVGVARREGEQGASYSLAKLMDPDGDYVVMEFSDTKGERVWKMLYGTGKWSGIKGSGKYVRVAGSKPIKRGTDQGQVRSTGTFELPK